VPSQIAYSAENAALESDTWGYEVQPGTRAYCWTKLLLDKDTLATEYDDPSLQEASGGAALKVPADKKPVDVVADFLGHLYKHCISRIEKTVPPDVLRLTPIDFWFTMPAIWSDEAQHATKTAAERAGFGQRPGDTISMITEPEAAALAAFKTTKDRYDDLLEVCQRSI
jgi:molecular chaperone DnaK (HSP70)